MVNLGREFVKPILGRRGKIGHPPGRYIRTSEVRRRHRVARQGLWGARHLAPSAGFIPGQTGKANRVISPRGNAMRPVRFWTGVLVGLAACLGPAVPAQAQEPVDECCALPAPAAAWWQKFLVVQKGKAGRQPGTITHAYKCIYVPAGEALTMLERLLGGDGPRGARGGRLALVADARTNTLFARGPAERVEEAEASLTKLDVPAPKSPDAASRPELLSYAVPDGQADTVARLLQKICQRSPGTVVIQAVSPSKVAVFAEPNTHLAVARDLHQGFPPTLAEVIPLTVLDAARAAAFLDGHRKEPLIEAGPTRNALLVKGTR